MNSPETGPDHESKKPDINRALEAAVSAIYFDDSSDYKSALWQVIKELDPDLVNRLEEGSEEEQSAVYDEVKRRVNPNYKP